MKPLNYISLIVGIILVIVSIITYLLTLLAPTIPLIKLVLLISIITIILGVPLIIWKWFADQAQQFFGMSIVQKITLTVILITLVYVPYFYICYGWIRPMLIEHLMTISPYIIVGVITLFQAPMAGVMYYLVSPIWPERAKIGRGFLIISFFGSVAIGAIILTNSYPYFDSKTGKSQIWFDDDNPDQIYYVSGFSKDTGKLLRQATKEDIDKLKLRKKMIAEAKQKKSLSLPVSVVKPAVIKPQKSLAKAFEFRIPPGQIIEHDIQGKEIPVRLHNKVRIITIEGKYGNLLWVNDTKPYYRINSANQLLRVLSEGGKDYVRLTNDGSELIVAKVIIS